MRSGFALGLILLRLLLLSGTALGAEIRKTPMVAPLEETGDGYLVLKVRLHDRSGTSKAFRFLLDTGAATTMIDSSIPDGYFWDVQGIDAKASDGNGKEAAVRAVTLKRVDVAGLMRDEVPAMRADLKNSMMGRMQDEPVDGILGMSFLRNTRFLLDAGRKRLTWSADFPEGQVHRIAIGPDDHAYLDLKVQGKTVGAVLDTGNGGGIILPKSLLPEAALTVSGVSAGINGSLVSHYEARLDVAAGDRTWPAVPVRLEDAEGTANLGLRIFKAGPTFFDFTFKLLVLPAGAEGCWAILPKEPARKATLAWTRKDGQAWLEVLHVVPGSACDRAGLQAGDRLKKVGPHEGPTLTLRAMDQVLASGEGQTWVIQRGSEERRLEVGPALEIRNGADVLEAMYRRWSGKWYRTLSFAQRTRTIAEDGTETKGVWYEALEHPGKLRIDYAPLEQHSGLICAQDRIFHFKDGQQVRVQETWNHLLVLVGDVYCQDVSRSIEQLSRLGFDLGRAHRADWKGRACWVVGADAGDEQANQFWIDSETFLLQRVIRKEPPPSQAPRREVQILEYQTVSGFPIASLIHFFHGGRLYFSEDYFDIRVNTVLDPNQFRPEAYASTQVEAAKAR